MNSNDKTLALLTHLSTLTQYFFPFGNFILPLVIWSSAKKNSEFVDAHGKEAINFQLSVFLYTIGLALIAIPVLLFSVLRNVPFSAIADGDELGHYFSPASLTGIALVAVIAVLVFFLLKVAEFFLVIYASVKAANGEHYQYPLRIRFIK